MVIRDYADAVFTVLLAMIAMADGKRRWVWNTGN